MINPELQYHGFMMVLSSPSGAGKTTLTRTLLREDPSLSLSISVTTRRQRPGEVEGVDYRFISQETFDGMVTRRELLEHAYVFENSYGTPAEPILSALNAGRDVIGDVDWQGTQALSAVLKSDLVSVFVLPPSMVELERRLMARNQDSPAIVAKRMAKARDEVSHWSEYEYVLINQDLAETTKSLHAIIQAERAKRVRQNGLVSFVRRITAQPNESGSAAS